MIDARRAQAVPVKSFGFEMRAEAMNRTEQRRVAALAGASTAKKREHHIHASALQRAVGAPDQRELAIHGHSDSYEFQRALEYRLDEYGARITALEQQVLRLMERQ
jgi:hypothetical protein